jgi:hypothetical protein
MPSRGAAHIDLAGGACGINAAVARLGLRTDTMSFATCSSKLRNPVARSETAEDAPAHPREELEQITDSARPRPSCLRADLSRQRASRPRCSHSLMLAVQTIGSNL